MSKVTDTASFLSVFGKFSAVLLVGENLTFILNSIWRIHCNFAPKKIFNMEKNKTILNLTVREFIEVLQEGLGFSSPMVTDEQQMMQQNTRVQKHYVYGLKGLCTLLGCSLSTAARIKKSGAIDAATSQRGKIIVFDADLVLDLLSVKRNNRGNRMGYKK